MPAAYFHEQCALRALELLPQGDSDRIVAELPAYLIGSLGPDLLFFNGILPPFRSHKPNHTGVALHAQGGHIMAKELLRQGAQAGQAARAWALGYLCHWASDAAVHPYILSRSGEFPYAHGLLEMGADTQLYQLSAQGVPRQMLSLEQIGAAQERQIAGFFCAALRAVLPGRAIGERRMRAIIADARRLHRVLYSPDGKRFGRFARLERMLGKPGLITCHMPPPTVEGDPLNLARRPWRDPAEPRTERRESMTDLLHSAAQVAASRMAAFMRHWQGEISAQQVYLTFDTRRMCDGRSC